MAVAPIGAWSRLSWRRRRTSGSASAVDAGVGGELEQALEFGERAKADVALEEIGAHPEIVGDHHRDDHFARSRGDIR